MTDRAFADRYGPVAVVTGASSGIGQAFAESLAARGLDLVLVARREDRLADLAGRLEAEHGIRATVCPTDLADPAAPERILAATSALDVGLVVSNAGFGLKGEHAANDPAAMTDMLMVNCNMPMQLAHGFIPRLRQRRAGGKGAGIVLTSSIEALIGCPYSAAYSASKALVNAFGEALWAELQPEGIDVLTLCPGATDTEAPGKQGIDVARLSHVMAPSEVAELTLAHIAEGPVFFSSEHYRQSMERLLSMPRREALLAMAAGMRGS